MDILATTRISLPVYKNQRVGTLIDAILDEIGWDSDKRQISTDGTALIYFWADDEFALDKIHELEDCDGGMFYVDKRGYAVWESCYDRFKSPLALSQYTVTLVKSINYEWF